MGEKEQKRNCAGEEEGDVAELTGETGKGNLPEGDTQNCGKSLGQNHNTNPP